jgi:hypothetical protein
MNLFHLVWNSIHAVEVDLGYVRIRICTEAI